MRIFYAFQMLFHHYFVLFVHLFRLYATIYTKIWYTDFIQNWGLILRDGVP